MEEAEAGAATGAAEGSLPPRKRLLNSLKAGVNGGSEAPSSKGMVEGAVVEGAPGAPVVSVGGKSEESCARCGSKENSAWRRVKKIYQRLCNPCTMLYSMNMFCPYCLAVYQDAGTLGDPDIWLNCCQCKRSVHVACETKNSPGVTPDPNGYMCPECRKAPNGAKNEESTSPNSPSHKKPRTVKGEADGTDAAAAEAEKQEGGAKQAVPPKPSSSQTQEALQAAKNAAQAAARNAAAAKATALAKAQAAAKAALAARAALEAAAQAARAEVQARAELRRNGVRLEPRIGYHALTPKADASEKGKEESPGDEELARQLHRAMNSSPRTNRGFRRKPEGMSPGASPSAGEAKDEAGDSVLQKQQPRSVVKEEDQNHLFQQGDIPEAASVDTHGFPSTYLSDANNSFPFDILAGFPSHEMQAEEQVTGMEVDDGGAGGEGNMEIDHSAAQGQIGASFVQSQSTMVDPDSAHEQYSGPTEPAPTQPSDEKKPASAEAVAPPAAPPQPELASTTDTDVSFYGVPSDTKFEIPGKWNEDVKPEGAEAAGGEDKQQIGVEDYSTEAMTVVPEVTTEDNTAVAETKAEEPVEEPRETAEEPKEDKPDEGITANEEKMEVDVKAEENVEKPEPVEPPAEAPVPEEAPKKDGVIGEEVAGADLKGVQTASSEIADEQKNPTATDDAAKEQVVSTQEAQ